MADQLSIMAAKIIGSTHDAAQMISIIKQTSQKKRYGAYLMKFDDN